MYPNPQDALPLPAWPDLEQYKKRAKELVRACRSRESDAVLAWATQWIEALTERQPAGYTRPGRDDIAARAVRLAGFARTRLQPPACQLAAAQFVIARAHGFESWPKFAAHVQSIQRTSPPVATFEQAADAIIAGDVETLAALLGDAPELVHARSTREHHATLLHYVSANGVETYRQRSPGNAAAIAEMLLAAGAEVDAEAAVYGGGCTTLGLVATSAPPAIAGVQRALIDVLLAHGARVDRDGIGGHHHTLVRACLANGQPQAAAYLASRGAPLDVAAAAGLGRVEVVGRLVDEAGGPGGVREAGDALYLACAYGHAEVVELLLRRGIDVDLPLTGQGDGHTGLHVAAYHGHVDVVRALLLHGAGVEVIDKTWGTPPLMWALTGWQHAHAEAASYYEVVRLLVAAGAAVPPSWLAWDRLQQDPAMRAALGGHAPME